MAPSAEEDEAPLLARGSVDESGEEVGACGLRSRHAHRHMALSFVMLACTCYFAVEVGSVTMSPGMERSLSNAPRGAKQGSSEGPVDPKYAAFPWAASGKGLLKRVEAGKQAAKAARESMWAKHNPHSPNVFPSLHVFNATHLHRRMAAAVLNQAPFTIGVMGTSVTAGHDNFFNQSYPVVWGRLMEEAFAQSGAELTVRNHAMGWNPIHPSYFCVGEMVGEDVDMSVWEYGMMGGDDGDAEQWIRSSLSLPKQPHVLFLDPGLGARGDDATAPREGAPNPWNSNPMQWYTEMGFAVGSQVMEHTYWKIDHMKEYSANTIINLDKPTERPAGWHPGPHGHRLRAEVLAYNYLGHFIDALDAVYDAVSKGEGVEHLLPRRIELPEPKQCAKEMCGSAPRCVTSFVPRVGPSLLDHVVHPQDIPLVTEGSVAGSNEQKGWHVQLYFCDVGAVDYMLAKGFDYLDRKMILQGGKDDGPTRLEFESKTENYVVICSAPGNQHLCKSSEWKIDGETVECINEEKARERQIPVVHEPCFITPKKIPPGKHTFEVRMLEPFQDHDNFIPLSHLIWW